MALLRASLGAAIALLALACDQAGSALPTSPSLVALSLAPLPLSPPFSPEVHDYAVRCAPGPNSLRVSMQAASGVVATIQTPAAPTSVQLDGVTVNLSEDDAAVITTSSGAQSQTTWVRCLPHDFPAITFTPHPAAGTPSPGWYVLGNAVAGVGENGFAMVLNDHGTPVWYRRVGPGGALDVDVHGGGVLSYIGGLGVYGADPSASYVVQSLQPWQTRAVAAVGMPTDEHELRELPGGDYLLLSYPTLEGVDLSALIPGASSANVADCVIQELAPDGALVWQWRASDHVDVARESIDPETNVVAGQNVVDGLHCNSIDVDGAGNLLLSARNLNAVLYVERPAGKVRWKLGGTPYSKDGAQLLRTAAGGDAFNHQHDARFQASGHVSVFDDHTDPSGPARAAEYALDLEHGTATLVWQYSGVVAAEAMGSFRRDDAGSSVIGWGLSSQPAVFAGTFTEVDAQDHDLLDVSFGRGNFTYRVVKVPPATFDLDVLRATAGHP